MTINNDNQTTKYLLTKAFPSVLSSDVKIVINCLSDTNRQPEGKIGKITLFNEPLSIPFRIAYPEPDVSIISTLNLTQQVILSCLYTRYIKGLVREKHLLKIITVNEIWVLPFIFALAAEDVKEIIVTIYNNRESINKDQAQIFNQENSEYMRLTRHRIISFWDLYFRVEWPLLKDYPGYRIMSELGLWNSHDGRRLLRPLK